MRPKKSAGTSRARKGGASKGAPDKRRQARIRRRSSRQWSSRQRDTGESHELRKLPKRNRELLELLLLLRRASDFRAGRDTTGFEAADAVADGPQNRGRLRRH